MDRHTFPPIGDAPLFSKNQWDGVVGLLHFSARQAEIVWKMLHGKKDKKIGLELGISKYTVGTHWTRIYDRLGVDDKVGVVIRVFVACQFCSIAPVVK